jgi:UDP-N-acetylmuramoyl-tripeptide--D-alanyl-D-alanine ligase
MEEALKELVRLKRKRTIAVLGDMLELGAYSEQAHKNIVRLASDLGIDLLVAVGPEMNRAAEEFHGPVHKLRDAESARTVLEKVCEKGDAVLLKGSRGMHMERALHEPEASLEGSNAL